MMPLVGPGGVEAVPAGVHGTDEPRVVEVALGGQEERPALVRGQRRHLGAELLEEVRCRVVGDRVHRVEAQPVAVVVAQPHQCVVDDEPAYLVAAGSVEVDRRAPVGLVPLGEVRPELGQVVACRAEVVVDDVHDHAEAIRVCRVDQPLQPIGPAVGVMRGEQVHPVIAPAARAGELGDRQQLDRVHAEADQVAEVPDRPVERPLGRERADVALI